MAGDAIKTETAGGVFTVTLNRPEKLNAITPDMHHALDAAFDHFAEDDTSRVCVIKGAGPRAFCAGSDLSQFVAEGGKPYPQNGYAGLAQRHDLDKPVIAAVGGLCLGGGFEIALACDMIVASEDAVFGLPEPKVGVIAIGGGIHRLVRQIGVKQAMGPLLTGRNISAQEGFAMGFVSEIAPAQALDRTVDALCEQIIACAPLAVRLTKELTQWGLDQPTLAQAIAEQTRQPGYQRWAASEDAREGPTAFAQKRKPQWQGK